MTENRLGLLVDVDGPVVAQQIHVYICAPGIREDYPDCWTCLVGWTGPMAMERPAFGATALQALSLALPVLQDLLQLRFPQSEFLTQGRPLFF